MTTHVLWALVKLLALVVFINRYVAGVLIRILRGKKWDETRDDFEPTVTVVIPMYPIAVARALSSGWFFNGLQIHLYVITLMGLYYWFRVRKEPKEDRVGILSFLPIALTMPVTYALLTPLALFTLDSGSWETRGHEEAAGAEPIPDIG